MFLMKVLDKLVKLNLIVFDIKYKLVVKKIWRNFYVNIRV